MSEENRSYLFFLPSVIFLLGFTGGVAQHFGILFETKVLQDVLILFFVVSSFAKTKNFALPFQFYLSYPLVAITIIAFVSWILNDGSLIGLTLYLRNTWIFYLLFLGFLNFDFSETERRFLLILCSTLIIIQFPIAFFRLDSIGIRESGWIGTIHQTAGQIGLLFPLILVALIFSYGMAYKKHSLLVFFMLFLSGLFSVVFEKRAIVFLFPLVILGILFLDFYLFRSRIGKKSIIARLNEQKTILLGALFGTIFTCSAALQFIPSLNPVTETFHPITDTYHSDEVHSYLAETSSPIKQVIFRFNHLIHYTSDYMLRDYTHPMNASQSSIANNTNIQLGRLELLKQVFGHLTSQNSQVMFFGYGPSSISPSGLMGPNRNDVMFELTGLRGASSSFLHNLIEVGFLSGVMVIIWFLGMGLKIVVIARSCNFSPQKHFLSLTTITIYSIFCFDFFFYSKVMWSQSLLAPMFFFILAEFMKSEGKSK